MKARSIAVLSLIGALTWAVAAADARGPKNSWRPVPARLIRSLARQGPRLDLAEAALRLAPEHLSRRERRETLARIEALASTIRRRLPPTASASAHISAINEVLFREAGLRGEMEVGSAEGLSLRSLLDRKRGTCVGLVLLYLALAERTGLEAQAAATPTHRYVRVKTPAGAVNVETLDGGKTVPDSTYRRRHPMADESIERGVFLSPLSKQAALAHLMSNRGVLAARAGDHQAALRELNSALLLYPGLNAAHYNRGLSHLALEDDAAAVEDFTRAIALHPLDAQAHNNRGIAHLRLGEVEAARSDFEAALEIKPALREARENLKRLEVDHGSRPGSRSRRDRPAAEGASLSPGFGPRSSRPCGGARRG